MQNAPFLQTAVPLWSDLLFARTKPPLSRTDRRGFATRFRLAFCAPTYRATTIADALTGAAIVNATVCPALSTMLATRLPFTVAVAAVVHP